MHIPKSQIARRKQERAMINAMIANSGLTGIQSVKYSHNSKYYSHCFILLNGVGKCKRLSLNERWRHIICDMNFDSIIIAFWYSIVGERVVLSLRLTYGSYNGIEIPANDFWINPTSLDLTEYTPYEFSSISSVARIIQRIIDEKM